jgi:hypothetical protein
VVVDELSAGLARRMAALAIENIGREYPNAPSHLLRSPTDLRPTRELHPAFFGSYDWHSCVHQHWLLARLLRLDLAGPQTDAARAALATTLTPANLETEAAYLRDRPAFERTYGWAWLLKLADELSGWTDPAASAWREALAPAVDAVRANWMAFLPRATYPIRAGTHANSAFGLAFGLDHAHGTTDVDFANALAERGLGWFEADHGYPTHLEPGGEDFLSGALMEASLMTRLLDRATFAAWFRAFLPSPGTSILQPAVVADRSDPRTVHLDGLNLSRAWCWRTVADVTGDAGAARAADRHLDAALPNLFSGEYVGEHWISSFALLALTG